MGHNYRFNVSNLCYKFWRRRINKHDCNISLIKHLSRVSNFSFSSSFFPFSLLKNATRNVATHMYFAVQGVRNVENNWARRLYSQLVVALAVVAMSVASCQELPADNCRIKASNSAVYKRKKSRKAGAARRGIFFEEWEYAREC